MLHRRRVEFEIRNEQAGWSTNQREPERRGKGKCAEEEEETKLAGVLPRLLHACFKAQ